MLVSGNKRVTACTVKFWRENTSAPKRLNKKTGKMEHPRVPMYIGRIWVEILTPDGDGMVFCFTGMKRRDYSRPGWVDPKSGEMRYHTAFRWSDGRKNIFDFASKTPNVKPMNDDELHAEIARMTATTVNVDLNGEAFAVTIPNMTFASQVIEATATEVTGEEYADMIGAHYSPTYGTKWVEYPHGAELEAYESRVMEGGYLDRVAGASARVKATRANKMVVNKRR